MDFLSFRFVFIAIVLIFLLVYWVFNFIILYHLTRFGIGTQPKKFAAVFLLGSVALFLISALLFGSLDINSLSNRLKKAMNSTFNITYQK